MLKKRTKHKKRKNIGGSGESPERHTPEAAACLAGKAEPAAEKPGKAYSRGCRMAGLKNRAGSGKGPERHTPGAAAWPAEKNRTGSVKGRERAALPQLLPKNRTKKARAGAAPVRA